MELNKAIKKIEKYLGTKIERPEEVEEEHGEDGGGALPQIGKSTTAIGLRIPELSTSTHRYTTATAKSHDGDSRLLID